MQGIPKFPVGRTVSLSAYLRTDDAEAVNVCVQCWAKGGEKLVGFISTPVFRGTHGWTLVKADDLTIPVDTALGGAMHSTARRPSQRIARMRKAKSIALRRMPWHPRTSFHPSTQH